MTTPRGERDGWQPTISTTATGRCWAAPEKQEVWTKIDDKDGERNVAKLTRRGNLWFTRSERRRHVRLLHPDALAPGQRSFGERHNDRATWRYHW